MEKKKTIMRILSAALIALTVLSLCSCQLADDLSELYELYELYEMIGSEPDFNADVPFEGGAMEMHMIDVGQGDSILLTSDDHAVLVDAATSGEAETIIDYIGSLGIDKLDMVIATHPHADHIGGMAKVLNAVECDSILLYEFAEGDDPTTKCYEDMLIAIIENDIEAISAEAGQTFTFGSMQLEVLTPLSDDFGDDLNNSSIVCRAVCGDTAFMLTGDAEAQLEEELLWSGADLFADVLKVGHHGSDTSSTVEFLEAVSPEYALISVGTDNKYGHPCEETISSLEMLGIEYYQTNLCGTIIASSDGESVTVDFS